MSDDWQDTDVTGGSSDEGFGDSVSASFASPGDDFDRGLVRAIEEPFRMVGRLIEEEWNDLTSPSASPGAGGDGGAGGAPPTSDGGSEGAPGW